MNNRPRNKRITVWLAFGVSLAALLTTGADRVQDECAEKEEGCLTYWSCCRAEGEPCSDCALICVHLGCGVAHETPCEEYPEYCPDSDKPLLDDCACGEQQW